MSKPEILEMVDVHAGTTAELEENYVVHKLWLAHDKHAFLARVGPGVQGIATNGIAGTKGISLAALPELEIVGVHGVGVDAVDLETARSKGVRVTNTPDVLTEGVAELGMALLLDVARCVSRNDRYVRQGRWPKEGDPPLALSLAGRRLGILGLGRIGRRVAELASAFGMQIAYCGRSRKPDVDYAFYDDPVKLAGAVDCLMVSCVGGPTTAGLVSREVIEAVGPKGWLINIARGSVVDEDALVDALVQGRLGAAGLDVFAREPHVPEALLALDNVVLQPHQGSASEETRAAMGRLMLDNLAAHFAGRPLPTPVI
ncbi:MAG TPA: 2-hydroxyacid dehydrogenase [Geminicoccaceae bacterium]|nr:2-hydroxyacid dehydrogenase [Geminicoccaceae bacterium]